MSREINDFQRVDESVNGEHTAPNSECDVLFSALKT